MSESKKLENLLSELESIALLGDPEIAHGLADKALLSFIDNEAVNEVWERIKKWYS